MNNGFYCRMKVLTLFDLLLLIIAKIAEFKTLYEHIENTIGEATSNHAGHINIFKTDDIYSPRNF